MATEFPYSIDAENDNHSAQVIQVESSKLLPIVLTLAGIALFVAGLATGLSLWALSYADKARMESRLLQVKVEGFEKALWAAKIDPNPHLPGQPQ